MSTASNLQLTEQYKTAERPWLDRIGISASVLCAVHCMVAPFLLLLLPTAGTVWSHPAVHWVLAILVLPLALWVIYNGYRKHRKRWTLVAAGIGSACIVAGLIAPMVYSQPLFSLSLPAIGSSGGASLVTPSSGMTPVAVPTEHAGACSEACCPTVAQDADTGSYTLAMPPGGLITLLGSLLLVVAHMTNLVACRCYSRKQQACGNEATGCGCTA